MAKITFIEASGKAHTVDASLGESVMESAVKNGVPGIVADCGGACVCATCRIYIEPDWKTKVGEASQLERETMEFADDSTPNARLSCQITVTEELDGLIVKMPASQF